MCLHSSSAATVTGHILNVLYPRIRSQFPLLKRCTRETFISRAAVEFYDMAEKLRTEFELLAVFEEKQFFPSVLGTFNTKHTGIPGAGTDIPALLQVAAAKDDLLKELVEEIEISAEDLNLPPGHHIFIITRIFTEEYHQEKAKWYAMLNGWNRSCDCFIRAAAFPIKPVVQ
ncbi:MAG: hypothetical protein QM791_17975 [Ferruginibacter sp.]